MTFPRTLSGLSIAALAAALLCALAPAARAQSVTPVPSTATSQGVVTSAPDPTHEILSAAFQAQTDARSQSRLTSGNSFELLENGVVSFPRKFALVATATAQVFVVTMQWSWDATGKDFADALIAKARTGVPVRAIVDGLVADPRIVSRLRNGGVKVARFNPWGFNLRRDGRVHEKAVIVDWTRAIVGGMNIADGYALGNGLNGKYKDTDLFVEGYAAVEAARRFLELFVDLVPGDADARALLSTIDTHAQQPAAQGPAAAGFGRIVVHEPDRNRELITDYYLRCFRAAKRQILWHVKYAAPAEPLLSEIKGAAARGVRVVILTNSIEAYRQKGGSFTAFFLDIWTRRLNLDRLNSPGIEVWEYDHYIHSKALTIDGVMASIGSYNFDIWSVEKETEMTLVSYDPATVKTVEEMFERDLTRPGIVRRIQ